MQALLDGDTPSARTPEQNVGDAGFGDEVSRALDELSDNDDWSSGSPTSRG